MGKTQEDERMRHQNGHHGHHARHSGQNRHRLQKKRQQLDHVPSVELPPNLQETDDTADEDISAPRSSNNMFTSMNQPFFGLVVAAGSSFDRNPSSASSDDDDEDEDEDEGGSSPNSNTASIWAAHTTVLPQKHDPHLPGTGSTTSGTSRRHRKRMSARYMFRSFAALSPRSRIRSKMSRPELSCKAPTAQQSVQSDGVSGQLQESQSEARIAVTPTVEVTVPESNVAPVMTRLLEARDEMAASPSFDLGPLSKEKMTKETDDDDDEDLKPTRLARKLKDIFSFDNYEDVIAEYPAWFLKNVMLQGYLYITQKHVCFYSYLPKKNNEVAKTGYLSKTGKRNPKYSRFWFRLKGAVLSYYPDSSTHYFPHGQIDLRYAVAAKVTDREKEGVHFTIETTYRTYYFRADSPQSAREWVKSLQRVIFRSHNDGDSVKISLPIDNILDVEPCPMMEFTETCKIRVIDDDETYAIDEYFFSFFGSSAEDAFNILQILTEDSSAHNTDSEKLAVRTSAHEVADDSSKRTSFSAARDSGDRRRKVGENVKATLKPAISPRVSGEVQRASTDGVHRHFRKSIDFRARRSASETRTRSVSKRSHEMEKSKSTDSYVDPSISAPGPSSSDEPSASQILRGSDVFHSPTIRRRSGSASRDGMMKEDVSRQECSQVFAAGDRIARQDDAADPTTTTAVGPGIAGSISNRWSAVLDRASKQMGELGGLLTTQPMGYLEKVSGMWKGGHRHYGEPRASKSHSNHKDEDADDDPVQTAISNERFRQHFALPETDSLVATYFACIFRGIPLYGKIYVSNYTFCYRSLLPGTRTKLILPLKDIETVNKEKGFRLGYSGLCLVIKGHEEIFFEFAQVDACDDCVVTMLQGLEKTRYMTEPGQLSQVEKDMANAAMAERDALHQAARDTFPRGDLMRRQPSNLSEPAILFDDPKASFLNFKPKEPLRITCLTIGSRGDVQPYIALCKGLLAEGHKPKIATHAEFKRWIEGHGIEFAAVDGDPGELMRICIENGTFTISFIREANSKFRGWLDNLLASSWEACQGSDVLIESPSAMAGIHIAEKLSIPYFRAFTMPWTRTRAYPHAFIVPENRLGGGYNYFTYVMFDNVFWRATAGQVNRWRNKTLGLPNTSLEKMQPNKVPFLYNFSPSVVPPPLDYPDWIRVTGYWFLDEGNAYDPPRDLTDFISKARKDEKKLVYVGFGSIIVSEPAKMTEDVINAVKKADVRCVLSKGWSDRLSGTQDDTPLPPEIFQIKAAPHDWLFSQMDAAAHHGGSGTTGASLRAGIPTIIRPFFGDQYFFGSRVEDLGVGIRLTKWGAVSFARALWEATHSQRMIDRARILGADIRSENGVEAGIQIMYRDMEYARSLIQSKNGQRGEHDEGDEVEEESWTFVGPDGNANGTAGGDDDDEALLNAVATINSTAATSNAITTTVMAAGSAAAPSDNGDEEDDSKTAKPLVDLSASVILGKAVNEPFTSTAVLGKV